MYPVGCWGKAHLCTSSLANKQNAKQLHDDSTRSERAGCLWQCVDGKVTPHCWHCKSASIWKYNIVRSIGSKSDTAQISAWNSYYIDVQILAAQYKIVHPKLTWEHHVAILRGQQSGKDRKGWDDSVEVNHRTIGILWLNAPVLVLGCITQDCRRAYHAFAKQHEHQKANYTEKSIYNIEYTSQYIYIFLIHTRCILQEIDGDSTIYCIYIYISSTTGSANAIPLGSYKRLVYHCLPSGWWVHIGECLPRVHHKCSEHVVCAIPEIVKVELFAGTSLPQGFLQVSENKAAVPAWTAAKSLDRSVSSSESRFLCILVPPPPWSNQLRTLLQNITIVALTACTFWKSFVSSP